MSRLSIVIFGATGFTGKKAVEEMVRIGTKYTELTWGVAGRSREKLEKLIKYVSNKTGSNLASVKIIIADVNDEASLKAMCNEARVVVSCCGPYRLYGEPVVKAAIDCKSHYVDVSGEPQFMETMQLNYDKLARDAGVYVISACGLDCIPNDMGVVFLEQKFDGVLNSVESYLSAKMPAEYEKEAAKHGVIDYGTWESLVLGLSRANELAPLRKKLYPERLPSFKPKLQQRTMHKKNGLYSLPFPGANNSVVYRSQRFLYENEQKRPVQFRAYIQFPSLMTTLLTIFGAMLLYAMSLTSFTTNLLLKYPTLFTFGMVSKDGPRENVMNNTTFQVKFYGEGWSRGTDVDAHPPNKKMCALVSKSINPCYGATVTALLLSAVTILKEHEQMPGTGGVMTTGAAFRNTNLIQHLNSNNITFEIIENNN